MWICTISGAEVIQSQTVVGRLVNVVATIIGLIISTLIVALMVTNLEFNPYEAKFQNFLDRRQMQREWQQHGARALQCFFKIIVMKKKMKSKAVQLSGLSENILSMIAAEEFKMNAALSVMRRHRRRLLAIYPLRIDPISTWDRLRSIQSGMTYLRVDMARNVAAASHQEPNKKKRSRKRRNSAQLIYHRSVEELPMMSVVEGKKEGARGGGGGDDGGIAKVGGGEASRGDDRGGDWGDGGKRGKTEQENDEKHEVKAEGKRAPQDFEERMERLEDKLEDILELLMSMAKSTKEAKPPQPKAGLKRGPSRQALLSFETRATLRASLDVGATRLEAEAGARALGIGAEKKPSRRALLSSFDL